jgi:hypothetical protein
MKNDLQILIDILQEECDTLEKEIEECVHFRDFQGAYGYQQALIYTREKLRTLKHLDEPHFEEIERLRESLDRYRKFNQITPRQGWDMGSMDDIIRENEQELEKLEKLNQRWITDSDELIACQEKLLIGEIKQFDLSLTDSKAYIRFSKQDTQLLIRLRMWEDLPLVDHLHFGASQALKQMGFLVDESEAIYTFEPYDASSVQPVMQLLSRILMDVLKLYGGKRAQIRY